uniref:(northern house mosquito) hypothetical protein n=1 Tax=Culex pipiens TaxID=7175 RepID=A0A8D8I0M3_CULPI
MPSTERSAAGPVTGAAKSPTSGTCSGTWTRPAREPDRAVPLRTRSTRCPGTTAGTVAWAATTGTITITTFRASCRCSMAEVGPWCDRRPSAASRTSGGPRVRRCAARPNCSGGRTCAVIYPFIMQRA